MLASILSPAFHVAVPDSTVECLPRAHVCDRPCVVSIRSQQVVVPQTDRILALASLQAAYRSARCSTQLGCPAGSPARPSSHFISCRMRAATARPCGCRCIGSTTSDGLYFTSVRVQVDCVLRTELLRLFFVWLVRDAGPCHSRFFHNLRDACCHFPIKFSDSSQWWMSFFSYCSVCLAASLRPSSAKFGLVIRKDLLLSASRFLQGSFALSRISTHV